MVGVISSLVPRDVTCLLSLFMGSGVFEYNYAQSHPECQVLCFDTDPAVVNFHRQALQRRIALHSAIMMLHDELTMRKKGATLIKSGYQALFHAHKMDTRQSRLIPAARFYMLTAYSFSGKVGGFASKKTFLPPVALQHKLPRNIQVMQGDALDVLRGENGCPQQDRRHVCLYLDPPYYLQRTDYYNKALFDHNALPELLRGAGVRWVLSYNDVKEVHALYRGLPMVRHPITYKANRGTQIELKQQDRRAELVITNQALSLSKKMHLQKINDTKSG